MFGFQSRKRFKLVLSDVRFFASLQFVDDDSSELKRETCRKKESKEVLSWPARWKGSSILFFFQALNFVVFFLF